jgi:hypothetical protein
MSRRTLRRTVSRLLLFAPALPLLACSRQSSYRMSCYEVLYEERITISWRAPPDGGTHELDTCQHYCMNSYSGQRAGPEWLKDCSLQMRDGGTSAVVTCQVVGELCEGRRPEGLVSRGVVEGRVSALGALFARMAHLEAASVPAFERLAEELANHGAPARLVRAARRSASDEVRHMRAMRALAQRYGAPIPPLQVEPFGPRPLAALALENAVEGCVRETFGALVAGWQARCALDPEVRRALGHIAPDELRHAELSWAIDAWASRRLSASEREHLREARHEALRTLARSVAQDKPVEAFIRWAGMPSPEAARMLVRELTELVLDLEQQAGT